MSLSPCYPIRIMRNWHCQCSANNWESILRMFDYIITNRYLFFMGLVKWIFPKIYYKLNMNNYKYLHTSCFRETSTTWIFNATRELEPGYWSDRFIRNAGFGMDLQTEEPKFRHCNYHPCLNLLILSSFVIIKVLNSRRVIRFLCYQPIAMTALEGICTRNSLSYKDLVLLFKVLLLVLEIPSSGPSVLAKMLVVTSDTSE